MLFHNSSVISPLEFIIVNTAIATITAPKQDKSVCLNLITSIFSSFFPRVELA